MQKISATHTVVLTVLPPTDHQTLAMQSKAIQGLAQ